MASRHAKIFNSDSDSESYKLESIFFLCNNKPYACRKSYSNSQLMIPLALSWFSVFFLTILGVECKTHGKVAAAWYTGWHATGTAEFPLSKVSWSKYTHITYAFA